MATTGSEVKEQCHTMTTYSSREVRKDLPAEVFLEPRPEDWERVIWERRMESEIQSAK